MRDRIRFTSAFLLILTLLSVVSLVEAQQTLDVERPDNTVSIDRLLGKSNNDTPSDVGVSLGAYVYQYSYLRGPPYYTDFVNVNVSMIANTRRGIQYSSQDYSVNDAGYGWVWNGPSAPGSLKQYTNFANDSGMWVDLPVNFSFVFYGVKYLNWTEIPYASHVWISTNGFVGLDNSNSTSTGPAAFPSPDTPNAVIAPFWTGLDFVTGQSEIDTWISYQYNGFYWFVVKWVNMTERGTSNRCTFGLSFRIYSRNVDGIDPIPDRNHLPSSDIWFFYNNLKTPAGNFTYGLEDQTGYKGTIDGGTLNGSWATQFNGTAKRFYNVYQYYVKSLKLTFQDSNPNGKFNITVDQTFGRGLYTLPNPPRDSSLGFAKALGTAVDWGLYTGDVAVGVGEWLVHGGIDLGPIEPFLGPVGWILLAAEGIKLGIDTYNNWFAGHQYQPAQPNFVYNNNYAYVQASAFDNYTKLSDTVLDASLETGLAWICGNDYSSNHTLTITATVGYGQWENSSYDNIASTSISINLFSDNNNVLAHAQQVSYGFYGNNPLLYLGESGASYDHEDYYNITLSNNVGVIVDVCPSTWLELFVYVSGPNGVNITSSTNTGGGVKQEVRFMPTCAGNYTIRVHGVAGQGFYNMTISYGFTLTVSASSGGTTNPSPGTYVYKASEVASFSAVSYSGYVFSHWQTDWWPITSFDNPINITMNVNHVIKAWFTVPGGGGGGSEPCPGLLVWNGSVYLPYGIINIHNPEGVDVVRQVPLSKQDVCIENCTSRLMLIEGWVGLNFSESDIDRVKLYATDRGGNRYLCPLVCAVHSREGNVLLQLLFSDDWKTQIFLHESITLTFLTPYPDWLVQGFTFVIEGCNRYKT